MITPEYLNDIMDAIEERASGLANYLLQSIAKAIVTMLKRGDDFFMPSTLSDLKKLMAKGFSLAEVERILAEVMPGIQADIRKAFLNAAQEISLQNIEIARKIVEFNHLSSVVVPKLEQIGIVREAKQLHMTPTEIRKMEIAYKRTNGTVKNITKTLAGESQKAFINTCDDAYLKVQAGVSPQKAIIESIELMCEKGIEYVDYQSGRSDRVEVAVARAVRTGVNQANSEIVMERCAETGINYVITSSHLGARVKKADDYTNHSWWQGRVFSIDWSKLPDYTAEINDDSGRFAWMEAMRKEMSAKQTKIDRDYPDFVESCGWGNMLGIGGINCRHSFYPFTPGVNIIPERPDEKENEKRYRLDQKQRAMEREIRKTKRMLEGAKGTEEKETIKQFRNKLKAQMEAYMDFCQKNGLKPRMSAIR